MTLECYTCMYNSLEIHIHFVRFFICQSKAAFSIVNYSLTISKSTFCEHFRHETVNQAKQSKSFFSKRSQSFSRRFLTSASWNFTAQLTLASTSFRIIRGASPAIKKFSPAWNLLCNDRRHFFSLNFMWHIYLNVLALAHSSYHFVRVD